MNKQVQILLLSAIVLLSLNIVNAATIQYNTNSTNNRITVYNNNSYTGTLPPSSLIPSTETNVTNQTNLQTFDTNVYYCSSGGLASNGKCYQRFVINVSDIYTDITNFNLTWNGQVSGATYFTGYFYLWNATAGSWFNCAASTTSTTNVNISCFDSKSSYSFNASDFVNSTGFINFLVEGNSTRGLTSNVVGTNYFSINVTYNNFDINSPTSNQQILNNLSTVLNTSQTAYNHTIWYTWNNGIKNYTLCTNSSQCSSIINFPRQGFYNLTIWANKSDGATTSRNVNNLLVANFTSSNNSDIADVYFTTTPVNAYPYGSQVKWNLTNLNLQYNSTIYELLAGFYIYNVAGTNGNNVSIFRVNNQTWNEQGLLNSNCNSGNVSAFTSMELTNNTNTTLSSISDDNYTYFDVSSMIKQDLILGNSYSSIRFWIKEQIGTPLCVTPNGNFIGSTYSICDKDNNCGFNKPPILNVTYYSPNSILSITNTLQNNSNYSTSIINFTYNITDDNDYLTNISFILDGIVNTTVFNVSINNSINNTFNFTINNLAEGTHYWNIRAYDSDGVISNSTNFTFMIDSINPSILITSPTNNTNSSNTNLNINYTVSDTNINSCWYSNDTFLVNTTISCSTNISNVIWSEGNHNVIIWTNDTLGNINSSSVTFFIDSIAPITTATATGYTFGTWTRNSINIVLDSVDTGIGIDQFSFPKYCIDQSNSCTPNTFIGIGTTVSAEGINYIRFYANDTLNNLETIKNETIKIDLTSPSINILSPVNNLNTSNNQITINYTVSDSASGISSCWWSNDSGVSNNSISCNQNITQTWKEGFNSIRIYVNDTVNNLNSTSINFTIDLTAPNLILISPSNNSYNNTDQNFSSNITDNIAIKNATLFIYNSTSLVNQTDFTFSQTLDVTIGIIVSLTDGIYNWFYKSFDFAGNNNYSQNYTLTIDKTNPLIEYNPSTSQNNTWKQSGDIFINISINETNVNELNLEFNGINETFDYNLNNNYWENKTDLTEGTYTFYSWITDLAGNFNKTILRNISIDLTNPEVSISFPGESDSLNYNTSIALNYTFIETNLDKCWYNLDNGINISLINCQNTSFNTSEGPHSITVFVNDSSGRIGSHTHSFQVNLAAPGITLQDPLDLKWENSASINFTYIPSHSVGISVCQLWTNSTGTWQLNQTHNPTNNVQDGFILDLNQGAFLWGIYCNSTGGIGIFSGNRTVFIDSVYPQISFNSTNLQNNSNSTLPYIYSTLNVSELNFKNITYRLFNESQVIINSTTYSTNITSINWSKPNGIYFYNVTACDNSDNCNSTETRKITLDNTAPTITITSPTVNGQYNTNNSIALNFSVTDNLIGVKSCAYRVVNSSGYLNIPTTTITNCQNITFALPGGDVNYTLTFYSEDYLSNLAISNVIFGIRTISPAITLYPINDTQVNYTTNHQFNFTSFTNTTGISTCELWGNWTGTWAKNQTLTSVSKTNMNGFNKINFGSGEYLWAVWCNDTLNNQGWSFNNTYVVDLIAPNVNITNVQTTTGSQTILANFTSYDLHEYTCKYSIYNSTGEIDGLNSNISVTSCNNFSATVSAYGSYSLLVYATDKATNVNYSNYSFSTTSSTGGGGGGGQEVKVVEKIIPSNRTFCGDGICQKSAPGNDAGVIEDFYQCSQDCPGFNIDSTVFGCFDKDDKTVCVWEQLTARYVGLFMGILIALLMVTTVEEPKTKRQVTLFTYSANKLNKPNMKYFKK